MTAVGPLSFPGSRTLAGWGRQLASWHPQAWWVGHILLHRVEALARCTRATRLEPLQLLLLKALAVLPGESLEGLQSRLHLDRQLLDRLLRALPGDRLIETDRGLRLTQLGTRSLEQGEYPRMVDERRAFYFVENERPSGSNPFLPLVDPPTRSWPAGGEWHFDVNLLAACARQPLEWKQRFGFPLDVESIVDADANLDEVEAWRRVILDRPERLVAVLALVTADGGERLLGFAVQQDGWTLMSESPLFTLSQGWQAAFPDLVAGPSQPSDVFKRESWILAGEGRIRAVTALEP